MIINLDTGATARSCDTFNGACVVDGTAYLITSAGLVALDEGTAITGEVTFATMDFGSSALKYVPYAYAGVAASGSLSLDVSVLDATYTYPIRRFDPLLQQQRFDLGRGLRSNWYKVRLYNEGEFFELADFSLTPAVSTRRI